VGHGGEIAVSILRRRSILDSDRLTNTSPRSDERSDRAAKLGTKIDLMAARYSAEEREQIAELLRILSAKPQQFRLQFLGPAYMTGPTVENETNLWAPDASVAVRIAVEAWPAEAIGLRIVDRDGCTVFERLRGAL
jgi:hypothetical protein